MKRISIVTPCYNEEANVEELYRQVKQVFAQLPGYSYEHIFIDNASKDRTVEILKRLHVQDKNVKIIVNTRNFGHIRSPYHALLQARGDAVILIVADLQDPPTLIADFLKKWESGYKIVLGIKNESEESALMFLVRKAYYNLIGRISDVELNKNNTGFGLYDQCVIAQLRELNDPYPYFRGLVAELGYEAAKIQYTQPRRKRGLTKNNFYTLYDIGMLGITSHSKIPLRVATLLGFTCSAVSLVLGLGYLIAKLLFWYSFTLGLAPIVLGVFFFGSMQLFFIGIIGEYIGFIYTQTLRRPLVVEKERIGFEA